MARVLATTDDVADMWRPLTTDEVNRVRRLISKASSLLRQKSPWLDARLADWDIDPTDPAALAPETVATVVATIVKRFLVNPDGATNLSETTGPFSNAKGFALRGDKDIRGELQVTVGDVESLRAAVRTRARLRSIGVGSSLARQVPGALDASTGVDGYRESVVADGIGQAGQNGWL